MKLITAVLRPDSLDAVHDALDQSETPVDDLVRLPGVAEPSSRKRSAK
jgi:nitrogen regulatory protein PII